MLEAIPSRADTLCLQPVSGPQDQEKLAVTKTDINKILSSFIAERGIAHDSIKIADSFFFIFNREEFGRWHEVDWWQQRRILQNLKKHTAYSNRAKKALTHSIFKNYYDIPDSKVGYYDDPRVSYGWMRKRLLIEESYWNSIDSIAYGAYYKKKYTDIFPGIGVLLCHIDDQKALAGEMLLTVDNGAGLDFKKTSKDSGMLRFLYKVWKLFYRRGLYLLGGLNLGLQETWGELYCYGTGAVTTQSPFNKYAPSCTTGSRQSSPD